MDERSLVDKRNV